MWRGWAINLGVLCVLLFVVPAPAAAEPEREAAGARLRAYLAELAQARARMDALYGHPAKAEATLLKVFQRCGVSNLKNSNAHEWGGWRWGEWAGTYDEFSRIHREELEKALSDLDNGVVKPKEVSHFDQEMPTWRNCEKELAGQFNLYIEQDGHLEEFFQRSARQHDKFWKELGPKSGDLTAAVEKAMQPWKDEEKSIRAKRLAIYDRVVALSRRRIFFHLRNDDYGH